MRSGASCAPGRAGASVVVMPWRRRPRHARSRHPSRRSRSRRRRDRSLPRASLVHEPNRCTASTPTARERRDVVDAHAAAGHGLDVAAHLRHHAPSTSSPARQSGAPPEVSTRRTPEPASDATALSGSAAASTARCTVTCIPSAASTKAAVDARSSARRPSAPRRRCHGRRAIGRGGCRGRSSRARRRRRRIRRPAAARARARSRVRMSRRPLRRRGRSTRPTA